VTSEVVLSNASSMVFGADTKVTVTAGPMRRESEAVKIHLIHGRTRYCGIPWGAWSSAYRRERPKPLGSIKEIAADFFEWLAHAPLVSAEDREVEARMNAEDLAGGAISEARMLVDDGRARDLPEALDIIIPQIQAQIAAATGSYTARSRCAAASRDLALGPYAAMPRSVRRRLTDLAEYAHASGLGEEGTGLVFGGFGEKEFLPSLVHLPGLRQVKDGIHIGSPNRETISLGHPLIFQTYGHDHGMRAVTAGTHAQVSKEIIDLCGAMVSALDPVLEGGGSNGRQAALAVSRKLVQQLQRGMTAIADERQSNFRSASAHMAAHELAELVALLVTSASIDERMSAGVQTEVGGSVDVLVMSREVPSVRRSITRSYQLEPLGV